MTESMQAWKDLKALIAMVPDDRGWMIQEKLIEAAEAYAEARFNAGFEAGADAYRDRT